MQPTDIVVLGVMLTAHLGASIYAYLDAPEHGMDSRRWGTVSFVVPVFGFFAYLFEKEERTKDPSDREEKFSDGVFEVHESRAEDAPFAEDSGEYRYGPEEDE